MLAYTLWRCDEDPRFARRSARGRALAQRLLAGHALEPGDHLLGFGDGGLRYCHRVDDAEAARLIAATALEPVARFHADAAEGEGGNDYAVLRRAAAERAESWSVSASSPRLVSPCPARRVRDTPHLFDRGYPP